MKRAGASRWTLGVVACTVVLLGLPVALVAASPSLATVHALAAADPMPPIPASPAGAPTTLDGIVDHLPYVARGFADPASNSAAAAIAALDPRDAVAAQVAYANAWDAMPTTDPFTATQLGNALMGGPVQMGYARFPTDADAALQVLTAYPDNAARMANAAVALFALGVAQRDGRAVTDGSVGDGQEVSDNAVKLLSTAMDDFSRSAPQRVRPIALNIGFMVPLLDDTLVEAVDPLASWLTRNPGDATVRHLLGSLLSRGYLPSGTNAAAQDPLGSALRVLRPLQDDPRTAALGDSATGDAYAVAAHRAEAESPYHARALARQALDAYDSALRRNRDPGLFAARAMVLDYLGAEQDAVAAQRLAVAAAPRSAGALIELAGLQEKLCNLQGCSYAPMRDTARQAERLLTQGWTPRLDTSRFPRWSEPCSGGPVGAVVSVIDPGAARGYLGYSYGSVSDRIPVLHAASGCGGGGAVFSFTLIAPTNDTGFDNRRVNGILVDAAAFTAMHASALLHDPAGADADHQVWRTAMTGALLGGNPASRVWGGRHGLMAAYDEAAHLATSPAVATGSGSVFDPPPALLLADTMLRRAGRLRDAISVCRASLSALAGNYYPGKCLGEASYLAGDYATAQRAFAPLYAALNADHRDPQGIAEDLLAAEVQLHHYDAARTVLAENAGDRGVVEEKLGEVALDANDFATAAAQFDRATAALAEASSAAQPSQVAEIAHSDHGIVLLRTLQSGADQLPDCAHHTDVCTAARADFEAALAMDAENPTFLLNLAWVQRLLGDTEAGRATLQRAVRFDPTLFPAYNDIGVAEAAAGNWDAARVDFEKAVAARPDYDLALWNLGVLEMRSVGGIARGQSLLARATTLAPLLRGESTTDLRSDERIYKVALGKGTVQPFNRTYGVAAALLGGVSLGGLAVTALVDLGKEHGRERVSDVLRDRARRLALLVERRAAPLMRRSWARPWMITAPLLVGLTAIVTAWTGQGTTFTAVLIASYAAVLGLLVHESGHLIAAALLRRRVRTAQSPLILGVAVLMLPLRLLGGPCVGHEVLVGDGSDTEATARDVRRRLVYAAGPLANLLVAVAAGIASLLRPLPMLRVVMLVQFGMVAFSFLPIAPMEGAVLRERHRRLVSLFLVGVVVFAILFSEGVL